MLGAGVIGSFAIIETAGTNAWLIFSISSLGFEESVIKTRDNTFFVEDDTRNEGQPRFYNSMQVRKRKVKQRAPCCSPSVASVSVALVIAVASRTTASSVAAVHAALVFFLQTKSTRAHKHVRWSSLLIILLFFLLLFPPLFFLLLLLLILLFLLLNPFPQFFPLLQALVEDATDSDYLGLSETSDDRHYGRIAVADTGFNRVQIVGFVLPTYDTQGKFLLTLFPPKFKVLSMLGKGSKGSQGTKCHLASPNSCAFNTHGDLIVNDSGHWRVCIFAPDGEMVHTIGSRLELASSVGKPLACNFGRDMVGSESVSASGAIATFGKYRRPLSSNFASLLVTVFCWSLSPSLSLQIVVDSYRHKSLF